VYVETTIVSYLTGRPSREIVTLGHQQITRDWWEKERGHFELYTSEVVIFEAERGDPEAARLRLDVLRSLKRLAANSASEDLVPVLLRATKLPGDTLLDMAHISIAAVHGMQYLLTWNCGTSRTREPSVSSKGYVAIADTNHRCYVRRRNSWGIEMTDDPIVEEADRTRGEIAAEFHGDVHAFFEYLRKREEKSEVKALNLEPVRPEPSVSR
jgi:hypothetical protein